ncbi:Rho GTPase activation protein, partial [Gorgonomyces haynaldii]
MCGQRDFAAMSNYEPSQVAKAALVAASNGLQMGNSKSKRDTRFSVAALWSMAAENDNEVDDDLTKSQKQLRDLKLKISAQSKRNFVLERDVRYLDGRIALLIQNRMALHEQQEVASHLEEIEVSDGSVIEDRKRQLYGNLFYLLQAEPRYMAGLARQVTLAEIDTLLQTIMFTLYGNQYETREEYLLLSMFQNVLAAEFEGATSFSGLMRANTPVSRMMTTYTRRGPGQTYLKGVLSERVNKLIELKDLNLEINPLKVYEQMIQDIEQAQGSCDLPKSVTPEVAGANPDVQAIIQPRVKTLMEIGASFLSIIMSSLDQVPYGIRWICKQIRSLTKRKYPEASESQKCSLIGGFFMLRFINPAIVTPQAYMIVEGTAQKNPRRTLTLVAKLLQNLANKPTHLKEPYMAVLNPFVEHNEGRFNKFLNDLCEVGDFYEALEMEQYVALSKKEIDLNINLNEIYTTHGLLLQHIDTLCPSKDDHLRIILNDLGVAPQQISRVDNKTIPLQLFSRWDQTNITDTTSAAAADSLTQGEFLYYDTKALFVQVLRLNPSFAQKRPLHLPKIAELTATSRDPSMVTKGLKLIDMLQEIERLGLVNQNDGFKLLVEEITDELQHLGNLREKVERELSSLAQVYKTIQDHNEYLKSQLDTYKSYLQNVRVQSGPSKASTKPHGPVKYTHQKLEQEGVIAESSVPESRRANIFFEISTPSPGAFLIALNYKGREKAILEMDLKLDDLLEKQQQGGAVLDLEYVKLDIGKTLQLLNKVFLKK